ncbi:glycosyltransferase family 4 protein [Synechocystis salina LEGE 06155]|nr:glycosyltransferase family 4 protein [Synechocystis salina LEGE 06155]
MTIRVAYDISLLGRFFSSYACKTGLFRVIEEVLFELLKIDSVDLRGVGVCDPQPSFGDICSLLYIHSCLENITLDFTRTSYSRLKLLPLYSQLMGLYNDKEFKNLSKYSPQSLLVRGALKICSHIQSIDNYIVFDDSQFNIFHSPYFSLPSKEVTKKLPRVLTIYDLIPVKRPEFSSKIIDSYFKKILSSIDIKKDWIICISEYTKEEFCEYTGMSTDRVFVNYLAAADHFHPVDDFDFVSRVRHRYQIPEGNYFLSLAALQPRKNFSHLIKCFFRFLSENPNEDIYLVLVGEKGWNYDSIFRAMNSHHEFRSRIVVTGYIPDEDLSAVYSGASVFIFPSLYEGFGLPILEAMQCGVPVVASNVTSLPEVVGNAGILVDPTDEIQMCDAMLNLLQDCKLRKTLQQKGIERAKKFSWNKTALETLNVYQTIINQN